MAVTSPIGTRATVAALLTLTAVTGLIDAVSYLRLGRVFVANMTGNVVSLGFSVYPHSGLSAIASLVAIGGFLLGALLGGAATRLDARPRRWLVTAFGAETLLVAAAGLRHRRHRDRGGAHRSRYDEIQSFWQYPTPAR